MARQVQREIFESWVENFEIIQGTTPKEISGFLENITRGAKRGSPEAMEKLCVVLARVAFITPEAIPFVYDVFTQEWLGLKDGELKPSSAEAATLHLLAEKTSLPSPFWNTFWGIIDDIGEKMSPSEITSRMADLGRRLPPSFQNRAENVARIHPGVTQPHKREIPAPLQLEQLATQPEGSLGHAFYRLIVENKFDLEVLDRTAIGLRSLPPALSYLNTRILQMHDIWHLVGGYTTLALHENSISAFQLAQFGHNYSAVYLATVALGSRVKFRAGLKVLLQVIAEGWLHGRKSPSFMDIQWENEWHLSIAEIRRTHGIVPYHGIYRADLIEHYTRRLQHPIFKALRWLGSIFTWNEKENFLRRPQ